MKAIADLEAATGDLLVASALSIWASDPSGYYKERGLPPVPVPRHGDDPDIGTVIAARREVIEPRQKPPMPSPFSAPVRETEAPAVEATPAPAA